MCTSLTLVDLGGRGWKRANCIPPRVQCLGRNAKETNELGAGDGQAGRKMDKSEEHGNLSPQQIPTNMYELEPLCLDI